MLGIFRGRTFRPMTTRKFTANVTLIGRAFRGEGKSAALNRVQGYDKVLLNKLSFFYLTGNVFTAF